MSMSTSTDTSTNAPTSLDPVLGIPVIRFCDRLDGYAAGYAAGVLAGVAMAKELRIKEAAEEQQRRQEK